MEEDHIAKIRNGCTLEEMTKINIPISRSDPLKKQMLPNFHYSSRQNSSRRSTKTSYLNENIKIIEPKQIPANHPIEDRFYPYSKAMITNKPLFSKNTNNIEKMPKRSITSSKFQTSRYPNVPLTKELSQKKEYYNSFYETENKKLRKNTATKSSHQSSSFRKFTKSTKILDNFQLWEKIKKEKNLRPNTNNRVVSEISLRKKNSEISVVPINNRPKTETNTRNEKKNEYFNTIESISSMLSPMAPAYVMNKIVPISPNLVTDPYTKYGHLFE